MQKIIYVPPGSEYGGDNNIEFSLVPPYILGGLTGTGAADTTVISSNIPGLDGVYVHGVRTESRIVSCFVHVDGKSRADMYAQRFALCKQLTPKDTPGTLYYINDFQTVKISAIPQASPNFTDRFQNYNKAEIKFFCPRPHWEDLTEQSGYMAYIDGGFEFDLEFYDTIEFAAVSNEVELENDGSVPVPVEITLLGPATNPAIYNDTTGEWIGLQRELVTGETLVVNTKRGEKSVTIIHTDGTKEDAFNYIDPLSVFWSLAPGINQLTYKSDNESEMTQISIRYHALYAGV